MLPCKFFYDQSGSRLFESICELDEYYLTRTEIAILSERMPELACWIGARCRLLEFGSGSSTKTRLVLDHLQDPVAYIPVDMAKPQLIDSAMALAAAYPRLHILAVCADFMQELAIPEPEIQPSRTVVFFPGSTIGNLEPTDAESFLRRIAGWCCSGGGVLIGVDLKKDQATLEAAYNDSLGVTARFNLNLLVRINRELGADFSLNGFRHRAVYNANHGRIEMHLASVRRQVVRLLGHEIELDDGEIITTEYSYKYDIEEFQQLAARAGFDAVRVWTDDQCLFSVHYLVVR